MYVRVIKDSYTCIYRGVRLTTIEFCYPSIAHSEMVRVLADANMVITYRSDNIVTSFAVATATDWDTFMLLKTNSKIKDLLTQLQEIVTIALGDSTPTPLKINPREWHLPYLWEEGSDEFSDRLEGVDLFKVSAARLYRVSYVAYDSTDTLIEDDISLADSLIDQGLLGVFGHIATPNLHPGMLDKDVLSGWDRGVTHVSKDGLYYSGNFRGWIQYKEML